MERLAELLANLAALDSLSDVDLENLKLDLKDAARQAREGELTAETTALLRTTAEKVGEIKAEQGARAEQAAQIIADADAAMALLDDDEEDGEADGEQGAEGTDESGTEDADAGTEGADAGGEVVELDANAGDDGSAESAGEAVEAAVPIAAAAKTAPRAAAATAPKRAVKVPARHAPRTNKRHVSIVASGEAPGIAPGHQFANLGEMNRAVWDRWNRLRGSESDARHHMATFDYRDLYPAAQHITGGDPDQITDQIMTHVHERLEEREAMVASGGVPGPAEPQYTQITYGQANRPLRDALPSFMADRGSLIYNASPLLSEIVLDTGAGAIGEVSSQSDASGATKDIQEISAPTPLTVTVAAETMRFSQGNFPDRFLPERTRAFLALGQVAYARHNDALRLADIKTGSTKYTDTPAKFGAYRDLKRAFLGQLEELEDRTRQFNLPVRVLMPEYVPAMLAADMISQAPGDNVWQYTEERMRADVESWDPNVTVTWLNDSIRGRMFTTPSGQSPRSAGFDADVEWAMFPEGAWVYLDGGQLDLGVIRDSVVSATNKFQTFFESWEAVAQIVNLSFWITSSLCADGASQAAAAINVCSPQGS